MTFTTATNSFTIALQDSIEYPRSGVFSKVLFKDNNSQYSLFCLAAGTEIDEHTSTRNAVITVVEGRGNLNLEGKDILLTPGVFVLMLANAPHALQAHQNLAFVLTLSEKSSQSESLAKKQQIYQTETK